MTKTVAELEAQVALLQGHVLRLRGAAASVIEWNRQMAKDQYGSADKANTWACVQELAEALAATRFGLPEADPSPASVATASWIIREKGGGKVLFETFDGAKVKALNTAKYEAVPIQQYLGEINRRIKAEQDAGAGESQIEQARHAPRG